MNYPLLFRLKSSSKYTDKDSINPNHFMINIMIIIIIIFTLTTTSPKL